MGVPTPMHNVLIYLAGPIGGIAAKFAWLHMWNMAMRYWKTGSIKKDKKDTFFNKDSSLLAIGGSFYSIYNEFLYNLAIPFKRTMPSSYGSLAGTVQLNDAAKIQEALAKIAPFLLKAYPFLAYAGLAGLMGYGAYGLYATYKAKKEAGQPLW